MKKRILGTNERGEKLEVSAIGLGCMGLSQSYPPFPDKAAGIAFLRRAVDMGVDFFDTAEVYGIYRNEELVGEALEPVRHKVKIATKCGWDIRDGKVVGLDSHPETIKKVVDGSLKRLRTAYIDIFFVHRVDTKVPIEEVAGTMKELFDAGKILHWGISEPGIPTLRRANAVFHLTAVQNEYSMWFREVEKDFIPELEELGIGLVAFSPLGKGVLTGNIKKGQQFADDDFRKGIPRFGDAKLLETNLELVERVKRFAEENGTTATRLALAWLLHQKKWIVPIPGTKKIERLRENIGSADVALSEAKWDELRELTNSVKIVGDRYDAYNMSLVGK